MLIESLVTLRRTRSWACITSLPRTIGRNSLKVMCWIRAALMCLVSWWHIKMITLIIIRITIMIKYVCRMLLHTFTPQFFMI